jgi:hypothetical protein
VEECRCVASVPGGGSIFVKGYGVASIADRIGREGWRAGLRARRCYSASSPMNTPSVCDYTNCGLIVGVDLALNINPDILIFSNLLIIDEGYCRLL